MPSLVGEYNYQIQANYLDQPIEGAFIVTAASEKNHGPVRIGNTTICLSAMLSLASHLIEMYGGHWRMSTISCPRSIPAPGNAWRI